MGLTDDQIEAKNFQKFYNAILPYLNPGVAYFGKNNVYSTDEKMIGQWIDKKPLYQKVITFTTPNNNAETILDIDTTDNISNARIVFGYISETGNNINWSLPIILYDLSNIQVALNGKKVYVCVKSNRWQNKTCYLVVQYTKATDTAMSVPIGEPNEYSTEEQVVGTWIDGKPIYQKTFVIDKTTMASIPLDYSVYNVVTSLVDIKQITSLQSYLSQYDTNLEAVYDAVYFLDNTLKLRTWFRNFDKIGFAWEGWNPNAKDFELSITIRYTKTTD